MLIFSILIKKFILPKSKKTDEARREFILNILLAGSIILALVAFVENTRSFLTTSLSSIATNAVPPYVTLIFLAFFCFLLFLSRRGYITLSSIILILFLSLTTFYTSWRWGSDVPQGLLVYALIIVMSGILIGTRFIFFLTFVISSVLLSLTYFQEYGFYKTSTYWRMDYPTVGDTVVLVANLAIIALVCWLFNREMEKTLSRARKSEEALRKQRDQLEIIVAERTQELKKVQVEKLLQLYRFAEFGRISSGLFHELVAPLNVISLNLEQARKNNPHTQIQEKLDSSLKRAQIGTERIESYLRAARKQIQSQDISQNFSLNEEIKQVIQMLSYKATHERIKILFESKSDVKLFGNPLKFNQLITNIVTNAIDSYDKIDHGNRLIKIEMQKTKGTVIISIQDWGCGIPANLISKIYDPLFTTKSFEKGTGIGLSLCKDIIEKVFKGSIDVISKEGVGTTFTIAFEPSIGLKRKLQKKAQKKK